MSLPQQPANPNEENLGICSLVMPGTPEQWSSLSFALQPFPSIFILGDACCNQQLPTRILETSIKSLQEAISALAAGAHDITVAPQVLFDMITDPQTDEAVEKFSQDWQKLK